MRGDSGARAGRRAPRPADASGPRRARARLALDPKTGDDWTRLYTYVFSVIEALDAPPFSADRRMDPGSPDVTRRLRDFAGWFDSHRRELEQLAAVQQPTIDEAQALLSQTATCRAP